MYAGISLVKLRAALPSRLKWTGFLELLKFSLYVACVAYAARVVRAATKADFP